MIRVQKGLNTNYYVYKSTGNEENTTFFEQKKPMS